MNSQLVFPALTHCSFVVFLQQLSTPLDFKLVSLVSRKDLIKDLYSAERFNSMGDVVMHSE